MASDLFKKVIRAIVPRQLRNWARSPSNSAEWLWDLTKFSLGTTKTLAFSADWSIVCHPQAYRVFHGSQIEDPEQLEEFRSFVSCCSDQMFLFDIGAHFGIFSLAAARFGGRSIAVDPSPVAVRMISIEALLNKCQEKIQIVQAAVSDTVGRIGMLSSGAFSYGYFRFAKRRSERELTPTATVTIDQLAKEFGIPTHIKIDVEGYEGAVLRGGRNTLKKHAPVLFLELHRDMILSEDGDPSLVLEELKLLDYNIFAPGGNRIERVDALANPITRLIAKRLP